MSNDVKKIEDSDLNGSEALSSFVNGSTDVGFSDNTVSNAPGASYSTPVLVSEHSAPHTNVADDESYPVQKPAQQEGATLNDTKFFVGGFHGDVTKENLKAYFSKFGAVADVKIMRNPITGQCRGFGFVTMADATSRPKIMEEKEHMICGRKASVRPYTEADMKESFTDGPILKRKIFVGGINPALGHEVLEAYFEKYGALEDATIMRYPDGRSRGFGFVVFRDESSCQHALQQRNHFVTLRDRVEVKACLSRGRSRHMGSMIPEQYCRYGAASSNYGCINQYHPGSGVSYSFSGSPGYYNPVPPSSMYGHYGRSGAYDSYDATHGGNSWGGFNDYRDWWGPYDSYSAYYGGSSGGTWHGANYSSGILPSQGSYGTTNGSGVPRSGALIENPSPQIGGSRGGAADIGYYESSGHAASAPTNSNGANASRPYSHIISSAGSGNTGQLAGAAPATHHTYAPLRRGGIINPAASYAMPRGRGAAY